MPNQTQRPAPEQLDAPWLLVAKLFGVMTICLPIAGFLAYTITPWINLWLCPMDKLAPSGCADDALWRQDLLLIVAAWVATIFLLITSISLGYWRQRQPLSICIFYSLICLALALVGPLGTVSWQGYANAAVWYIVALIMTWSTYFKNS